MNILIATDGTLDPAATAEAVARLHGEGDSVCVLTVVNFPRDFLHSLGAVKGVDEVVKVADEVGPGLLGFAGGAKAAELLAPKVAHIEGEQHPVIDQLVGSAKGRIEPIQTALEAHGIEAASLWRKGENQTARDILQAADELETDLLVIGSHGHGRYEGPLGSTGTKVTRRAPMNVLVIKSRTAG